MTPLYIDSGQPLAVATVDAIRTGNVATLKRLLTDNPDLANAMIRDNNDSRGMCRSLLHIATDWPGAFPNVAATISTLVEAGTDVNVCFIGPHSETPLHWAASSNDVTAIDALLDAGADIDAPGAVIGGGTPLGDATAFGQWDAARRLVERGARTSLWDAATLGIMNRIEQSLGQDQPDAASISDAFWGACHGGQPAAAEYLLSRGAAINWIPGWEHKTPLDAANRSGETELARWIAARGGKRAEDLR